MYDQQLSTIDQQWDLGIIITKKFKWQKQAEKRCKTANRALGYSMYIMYFECEVICFDEYRIRTVCKGTSSANDSPVGNNLFLSPYPGCKLCEQAWIRTSVRTWPYNTTFKYNFQMDRHPHMVVDRSRDRYFIYCLWE